MSDKIVPHGDVAASGRRDKLLNDLQEAKAHVQQWKGDIAKATLENKEKVKELEAKLAAETLPLRVQLSYAEDYLDAARAAYVKNCCAPKASSDPPLPVRQALVDAICRFEEYKGYRAFERLCSEVGLSCSTLHVWKRWTGPLEQDRERFRSMSEAEIVATIKNIILTTIQ